MNVTTLKGEAQDIGGNIKERAGSKAANDPALVGEGKADQVAGNADQVAGAAETGAVVTGNMVAGNADQVAGAAKDALGPLVDKAKRFAKDRPFAFAALAGVVGLALINTLRGKK